MIRNIIFLCIHPKFSILLFIFSLIISFNSPAQNTNLKFKQLSINSGLSYSIVTCVIQDKEGFLWFGTKNGLNKYDGYKFTIYKNNPLDSTSLSHNWMYGFCLLADSDGKIWVGTQKGLNCFDKATEKFERYYANQISNNSIGCIYMDYTKNVWIGTYSGLNLYNKATNSFFQYRQNTTKAIQEDYYTKILDNRDGNLILATKKGLWLFNIKNKTFSQHPSSIENSTVANSQISDILEDNEKNLWICTANNGLFCYNNNKQIIHFPELKSKKEFKFSSIYFGFQDRNNDLWFGTDGNGLYKYNPKNHSFQNFYNSGNEFNSIPSNAIYACCEDRSKLLWFGTMKGISYLDKKMKFDHYQRVIIDDNYTLNNYVTSFAKDIRGKLWIGTDGGGLCLYDRKSGKIEPYLYNKKLKSLKVIDLVADTDGKLWVGTWDGGLHCIDVVTNEIKNFMPEKGNPNSIMSPNIMAMTIDNNKKLWISTFFAGIDCYDKKNNEFIHIKPNGNPANSITKYVYALNKDYEGNIWVGNVGNGINRLTYDNNKPINNDNIKFFKYVKSTTTSAENINAFYEDSDHNLWIGSQNGLVKFNYRNEAVKVYMEKDGLPGNAICGILEDSHKNLWISSNKGISKFDRKNNTFRNYDTGDGLQSNQFNNHACFKDNDGTMYFGGANGFNVFHPDSIVDNQYIPPVVLTDFKIFMKSVPVGEKVNGRVVLTKSISMLKELELRYDESMITFEFAALNYIFPEKNQYAYILEGFDNSIHYVGDERSATYTNLNQGEYTFKVIASNNDGLWNNTGVSIKITILPPWWKTWWSNCLYFLLLIIVLLILRKNTLKKEKIRSQIAFERLEFEKTLELNQKSIEVEQMKITFFTNISHEFRTPLTLITGPIAKLLSSENELSEEQKNNNYQLIDRNSKQLQHLINQLLDFRKLETGNMKLEICFGNVLVFIENIIDSFRGLAQQKQIQFIAETLHQNNEVWFDPDKLTKIVNNLLSNAFKFTINYIRVQLSIIDKQLVLIVEDNGIGIPEEHIEKIFDQFYRVDDTYTSKTCGTGIGLALVKELIDLHKGTITVESSAGNGSRFIVHLPVDKEYLINFSVISYKTEEINTVTPVFQDDTSPSCVNKLIQESSDNDKPVLLIVEDNLDLLSYLKSFLSQKYVVFEATNGRIGFEQAIEIIPSLIVSDVMMPEMDGILMTRKLKTDERTSHIPIILLTALASIEHKIQGYETGADEYINKPFNEIYLLTRISNLLKSRNLLREKFSKSILLSPKEFSVNSADEFFLNRAIIIIEENMENPNFSSQLFLEKMSIGKTQLNAKLKAVTGKTIREFIRSVQLKKAALFLINGDFTLSEVCYKVGFANYVSFYNNFKDFFGVIPTEFIDQNRK